MTTTTAAASWFRSLAEPAIPFDLTPLPLLAGEIPEGLAGSLYRNGAGRLSRGGQRYGHWFDGDGAILAVHFDPTRAKPEQAMGVYRYVETEGYQAEAIANQVLTINYGTIPPTPWWQRIGQAPKNVANTSVLALPDRLLALWEAGFPHALDLNTLETFGLDDLAPYTAPAAINPRAGLPQEGLPAAAGYSAHPKQDPKTGCIFNFGLAIGAQNRLHIYRSDARGQIEAQTALPLPNIPLIHDWVLAGPYLVFIIPPVCVTNPWPVILGWRTFSQALTWQPKRGSECLVIDCESLEVVSRFSLDAGYQWHFGNGYVDQDGLICLTQVRYEDFRSNDFLAEVSTGQIKTVAPAQLWQLKIRPTPGTLVSAEPLVTQPCEFPTVSRAVVGQAHTYTYLNLHPPGSDLTQDIFRSLGRINIHTGELDQLDLSQFAGGNVYPSEPLFIQKPGQPLEEGWLITVVYCAASQRSEVWLLDSDLQREPVCRLGLPEVIPISFHGTWVDR